jgi:hypothetical protein
MLAIGIQSAQRVKKFLRVSHIKIAIIFAVRTQREVYDISLGREICCESICCIGHGVGNPIVDERIVKGHGGRFGNVIGPFNVIGVIEYRRAADIEC